MIKIRRRNCVSPRALSHGARQCCPISLRRGGATGALAVIVNSSSPDRGSSGEGPSSCREWSEHTCRHVLNPSHRRAVTARRRDLRRNRPRKVLLLSPPQECADAIGRRSDTLLTPNVAVTWCGQFVSSGGRDVISARPRTIAAASCVERVRQVPGRNFRGAVSVQPP